MVERRNVFWLWQLLMMSQKITGLPDGTKNIFRVNAVDQQVHMQFYFSVLSETPGSSGLFPVRETVRRSQSNSKRISERIFYGKLGIVLTIIWEVSCPVVKMLDIKLLLSAWVCIKSGENITNHRNTHRYWCFQKTNKRTCYKQ